MMEDRKRIFIINQTDESQKFGVGKYISEIINEAEFRKEKYSVSVVTIGVSKIINVEKYSISNTTYINIPLPFSIKKSIKYLSVEYSIAVFCIIKDLYTLVETDIFHFNSNMQHFLIKEVKENTPVKIIYTIHVSLWRVYYQNNFKKFEMDWYDDRCVKYTKNNIKAELENCKLSDKIICLSDEMESDITKIYKIPRMKVVKIFNGINSIVKNFSIEKFKQIKTYLNIDDNDFVLLYVGRLNKQKGVLSLVRVFKKVIESSCISTKLVIVGNGSLESELLNECKLFHDRILFTGYIDYKEVDYYYKMSNAIVFPSVNEQCSYVMLEAMANKVPMIVSDISAFSVLKNYFACLKVPLDIEKKINENKLKKAIELMIEDTELRSFLTENAYDLYTKEFTADRMFDFTYTSI